MMGLRRLLHDAWAIARPYWFSEDRWPARGLLLVVVVLNLGMVTINVLLNQMTMRRGETVCASRADGP
jgi:vitamin B12/bleomycin/antimicrobial peptide transport system ATP-binding/permease protein